MIVGPVVDVPTKYIDIFIYYGMFSHDIVLGCSTITLSQGNGRHLCPGIHLTDQNLFHAIAKILWAFDLRNGIDEKTEWTIVPD